MRFFCFLVFTLAGVLQSTSVEYSTQWSSHNRSVWMVSQSSSPHKVRLKGINWFGYETDCRVPGGLSVQPIDTLFRFLSSHHYNSIRFPFSYETIMTWDEPVESSCVTANMWMAGVSVRTIFHMFFQKTCQYNMTVVLDYHTIHGNISDTLATTNVTVSMIGEMWTRVLSEFSHYPHLMGIDVKNEPHHVSWEAYALQASDLLNSLWSRHKRVFRGLFFLEGVNDQEDHSVWGGSFHHMPSWFLNPTRHDSLSSRLVFSPHVYGPTVRGRWSLNDSSVEWDRWFGFLSHQNHTIVIGELGGLNTGDDLLWHNHISDYLIENDMTNVFYWCLNPDSHDTHGILLDDWETPDESKIMFHSRLQPNPTAFRFTCLLE